MTRAAVLVCALAAAGLAGLASPAGAAERYALLVTGASGGPEYARKYDEWRESFAATLRDRFGYPESHVVLLAEEASGPVRQATREEVRAAFRGLARRVTRDDLLLVLLIGHGTSGDEDAKFNLVGPDLTAAEWAALVAPIAGRVVFVNAGSASFEFLPALARRGRIVVTSTDSGAQQFETIFPGFFVNAFTDPDADLDRDGRVSIWEAFRTAAGRVADWFERQNQLATERPLLDDDGDGIGAAADGPAADGALARATYLQPDAAPADVRPEVAELLRQRAAVSARIDALRAGRAGMPADQYDRELEALLLELARLDREIREKP